MISEAQKFLPANVDLLFFFFFFFARMSQTAADDELPNLSRQLHDRTQFQRWRGGGRGGARGKWWRELMKQVAPNAEWMCCYSHTGSGVEAAGHQSRLVFDRGCCHGDYITTWVVGDF